jgi:hypothetical protein
LPAQKTAHLGSFWHTGNLFAFNTLRRAYSFLDARVVSRLSPPASAAI